ncbi:MAG: class I SAM-dependent methyltransferase [Hydrogenophaga sp.]|jgi:SAM-dependent methyltransferase|nr:class I SAM-dependent methyltransferase [Hydrogenophaga sp.]
MHGTESPSPWVRRWAHLIPDRSAVLDVACGHGRHMRHLAGLGHTVTGIDRDPAAIEAVAPLGQALLADIENGPWPLPGRTFGAVVVTNYLWRELLPTLVVSVAPGGVLIYETFGIEHAKVGRPSRPDFLLQPGELLQVCRDLRVVAYEDGFLATPERFVQRIVALREDPADPAAGQRRRLDPAG